MTIKRDDLLYIVAEDFIDEYMEENNLQEEDLPKDWVILLSDLAETLSETGEEAARDFFVGIKNGIREGS